VFVNEHEAALYGRAGTRRAAIDAWRKRARQTVIKLGRRGAIVVDGERVHRRPAPRVSVLDTTGAGDAFNAGFLAARLAGRSLDEALRLGNHLGAASTRRAGGLDGLPRRADLPLWAARLLEDA
jgi:sugar/nucleoside kinase (ribokinase family)